MDQIKISLSRTAGFNRRDCVVLFRIAEFDRRWHLLFSTYRSLCSFGDNNVFSILPNDSNRMVLR